MANEIFKLVATIETNGKAAIKDIKAVETQGSRTSQKLSKAFTALGKVMKVAAVAGAVAATASIVKLGKDGIEAFTNLQDKMNEVFTLLPGITADAMDKMKADVMSLAKEMGILPDEIVPALYQAISAGVPQENVFDFMRVASQAAIGGVTDLETAVDGLTSVVNAYGSANITASEAADVMFTAVRLGKTDFRQLSDRLFQVNPIAAALGVSFRDVAAAMAEITAQGTPTRIAATQLRSLFQELSTAGSDVADTFELIAGKSFQDFIAEGHNLSDALQLLSSYADANNIKMQDMFSSVEAGMAVLSLTGTHVDSFNEKIAEMGESAGATEAAYEQMNKGIKRSIDKIKAWWATVNIKIGEKLQKPVESFVEYLTAHEGDIENFVLNVFQKLIDAFQWVMDHGDQIKTAIKGIAAALIAVVAIDIALWLKNAIAGLSQLAIKWGLLSAVGGPVWALIILIGLLGLSLRGTQADAEALAEGSKTAFEDTVDVAKQMVKDLGKIDAERSAAAERELERLIAVYEEFAAKQTATVGEATAAQIDEFRTRTRAFTEEYEKLTGEQGRILIEGATESGKEAGEAAAQEFADGFVRVSEENQARIDQILAEEQATAATPPSVTIPTSLGMTELEQSFEKIRLALASTTKGTIEYAQAMDDLQSLYETVIAWQAKGVTGLDNLKTKMESLGAKTTKTTQATEEQVAAIDRLRKSYDEAYKALTTNEKGTIEYAEALDNAKSLYEQIVAWQEKGVEGLDGMRSRLGKLIGVTEESTAKTKESAEAQKKLAQSMGTTSDEAAKLQASFDDIRKALSSSEEGTIEYAKAMEDLKALYQTVVSWQEKGVKGLAGLREEIESLIGTTPEVNAWAAAWEQAGLTVPTTLQNMVNVIRNLNSALSSALQSGMTELASSFEANKEARQKYQADVEKIEEDTHDKLIKLNEDLVEKKKELWNDETLNSQEKFEKQRQLEADYLKAVQDAQDAEEESLEERKEAYEQNRKDIKDILKNSLITFLDSLLQQIISQQAATAAILALRLLAGDLSAIPGLVQAGVVGGAGIIMIEGIKDAVSGWAKGVYATGPTLGVIGEGRYNEVALPLSPAVYTEMGAGIVEAIKGMSYQGVPDGGDLQGLSFDRLEVNVDIENAYMRDEAEVDNISRLLAEKLATETRNLGLVGV